MSSIALLEAEKPSPLYIPGKNNLDVFFVLMVADDAFPAKILVLLSTSIERFGVSRTRDFFCLIIGSKATAFLLDRANRLYRQVLQFCLVEPVYCVFLWN